MQMLSQNLSESQFRKILWILNKLKNSGVTGTIMAQTVVLTGNLQNFSKKM